MDKWAVLTTFLLTSTVYANIVNITGDILQVDPLPQVQDNLYRADGEIKMFAEVEGKVLLNDLNVNISQVGTYYAQSHLTPGIIPAGTKVNSYFLHFDPVTYSSASGSICFDQEILGVIVLASALNTSNPILGDPNTIYDTRPLEMNGNLSSPIVDIVTVESGTTWCLTVEFNATTNLDNLRVVTAYHEPTSFPPDADPNGPYTVFVGDPLTLDGSGSTDPDNDIVSYLWDLDDDGTYETDAGNQPILPLNYAYLESINLLVDYTYTIHLKVTDSEGQSDIAETTLVILPKPAIQVYVDIKPGGCPNPLNTKSSGVLPVAILGTADFDVTTIDPTSILLAGVQPLRSSLEDVGTPLVDANDCDCTDLGPDGIFDLTLKFETQKIVETLGEVEHGDIRELELTGVLYDPAPYERPIEGSACVVIKGRHKPINIADVNKDGVVNTIDMAIVAENWLESSVVE